MDVTMNKVWIVDGIEPEAGQPRRAHATEDGAYAALGRYVHTAGYWSSDWTVVELEVAGGSAPAEVERPARPAWLDQNAWPLEMGGDGGDFTVETATGKILFRVSVAGLTSDQDREFAEYLAAVVNADRATS